MCFCPSFTLDSIFVQLQEWLAQLAALKKTLYYFFTGSPSSLVHHAAALISRPDQSNRQKCVSGVEAVFDDCMKHNMKLYLYFLS